MSSDAPIFSGSILTIFRGTALDSKEPWGLESGDKGIVSAADESGAQDIGNVYEDGAEGGLNFEDIAKTIAEEKVKEVPEDSNTNTRYDFSGTRHRFYGALGCKSAEAWTYITSMDNVTPSIRVFQIDLGGLNVCFLGDAQEGKDWERWKKLIAWSYGDPAPNPTEMHPEFQDYDAIVGLVSKGHRLFHNAPFFHPIVIDDVPMLQICLLTPKATKLLKFVREYALPKLALGEIWTKYKIN